MMQLVACNGSGEKKHSTKHSLNNYQQKKKKKQQQRSLNNGNSSMLKSNKIMNRSYMYLAYMPPFKVFLGAFFSLILIVD